MSHRRWADGYGGAIALALVVAGCTPAATTWTTSFPEAPPLAAQPTAVLRVGISFGSRLQVVPAGWDQADLTLANPSILSAPLQQTFRQTAGSTPSTQVASFVGLRPGSGYTLGVILWNAGIKVATGSQTLSLLSGTNSVTVTLSLVPPPGP
jgi:hypothetical protein